MEEISNTPPCTTPMMWYDRQTCWNFRFIFHASTECRYRWICSFVRNTQTCVRRSVGGRTAKETYAKSYLRVLHTRNARPSVPPPCFLLPFDDPLIVPVTNPCRPVRKRVAIRFAPRTHVINTASHVNITRPAFNVINGAHRPELLFPHSLGVIFPLRYLWKSYSRIYARTPEAVCVRNTIGFSVGPAKYGTVTSSSEPPIPRAYSNGRAHYTTLHYTIDIELEHYPPVTSK